MIVVDQCVEHIKTKNLKLWIFPEGTRNHNGGLLPFKKGAFNIAVRAQIPIVPIVISHYRPFYSKINRYFRTDGEIIIQVLPPVKTEGLSLGDVCDLTERIRDQMLPVYMNISEDARKKMEKKRPKLL